MISVVICTHNPRLDYLGRVIEGLKAQTLSRTMWELVIVDNASDTGDVERRFIDWHPAGRVVCEPTLGIVNARTRGVEASSHDLIVFVDDDNVLSPDYLEVALRIADAWPQLGVWGGQIHPEFEVPPAAWTSPYIDMLALRQLERDCWSNVQNSAATSPYGAGMVVRREVAETYCAVLEADPKRRTLGVKGTSLMRCEDTDLAFTAYDIGLGAGLFRELELIHLIPPERLELDYLVRLMESNAYSWAMLFAMRGGDAPRRPALLSRTKLRAAWERLTPGRGDAWRFQVAHDRGLRNAARDYLNLSAVERP